MDLKLITLFVAVFYILRCSSTESELPRFKNKYYFVINGYFATFLGAWELCSARNMKLVSIESQEENEFLNRYLQKECPKAKSFRTAGTRVFGSFSYEYYWSGTGKPFNYTNWGAESVPTIEHSDTVAVYLNKTHDELQWFKTVGSSYIYILCEQTVDFP